MKQTRIAVAEAGVMRCSPITVLQVGPDEPTYAGADGLLPSGSRPSERDGDAIDAGSCKARVNTDGCQTN